MQIQTAQIQLALQAVLLVLPAVPQLVQFPDQGSVPAGLAQFLQIGDRLLGHLYLFFQPHDGCAEIGLLFGGRGEGAQFPDDGFDQRGEFRFPVKGLLFLFGRLQGYGIHAGGDALEVVVSVVELLVQVVELGCKFGCLRIWRAAGNALFQGRDIVLQIFFLCEQVVQQGDPGFRRRGRSRILLFIRGSLAVTGGADPLIALTGLMLFRLLPSGHDRQEHQQRAQHKGCKAMAAMHDIRHQRGLNAVFRARVVR